MFILDTNVISELRKAGSGRADHNVTTWAASIPPASLFLSVINLLELERGVLLIERRDTAQGVALRAWLDRQVVPAFADRILPVTNDIARRCARLHIPNPRSERDALIAATALVHDMTVATRNVGDFAGTGVIVLNPWQA
ncbi:MAG TPA: type II toxin-antitoxin system VapC family toxin [Acetobacteraceae bacterium]|jgi:toxin FitB|nr:type II toxin-antitoxin system VapC family toxin [Acetobacteraceae bacterium]